MTSAGAHGAMRKLAARIRRLCTDTGGVAAVEFAFIAPILLILYLVTMEASQGIETSKKVSRVSSTVADLIAQQSAVDSVSLQAILDIADTTMRPYNRSGVTTAITAIQMSNDATPRATVAWAYGSGTEKKGDTASVPSSLNTPGAFLIRVTSSLTYVPFIAWTADHQKATGMAAAFSNIPMGQTYYVRPRMSLTIPCTSLCR